MHDARHQPERSGGAQPQQVQAGHPERQHEGGDGSGSGAAAEMLALQRTAGNAAATRVVAQRTAARQGPGVHGQPMVQRMEGGGAPPGGPSADAAEVDTTEADRALLRAYRAETENPDVQRLLDELLRYLDQVSFLQTGAGGGGYTRREGGGYTTRYSGAGMDPRDRIATLVHELTHVVVQEAYDSDMMNIQTPGLTDQERAGVMAGTPGREEDIQDARRRKARRTPGHQLDDYMDFVGNNVDRLLAALPGSGLGADVQKTIAEKLQSHTKPKPFHEYDGVLSHLLALCDTYKADTSSEFYRLVSEMVQQAAGWREAGAVNVPATGSAAPAAAPAAPAAPAAGRRRNRDRLRALARQALDVLKKLDPRRRR